MLGRGAWMGRPTTPFPTPQTILIMTGSYKRPRPVDTCSICMAEMTDPAEVQVLCCHHEFHKDCMRTWIREKKDSCPLCREVVLEEAKAVEPVNYETNMLHNLYDEMERLRTMFPHSFPSRGAVSYTHLTLPTKA